MPLQPSDKRALVCGGTGRIGRAIAGRLEAEGWQVVAAGRAQGDLRRASGAAEVVAYALAALGGLDLVVHAAGDGFAPKAVEAVTEADWEAAFGVTAKGTFFLGQAAAPALREARGVLVLVEDVASFRPWPSFVPHAAAKAAQAMLTRALALALAPDVRVCGIAPGPVAVEAGTDARRAAGTALGRVGSPEDVAAAVSYLAGAKFVTGSTLFVDGGQAAKSGLAPGT